MFSRKHADSCRDRLMRQVNRDEVAWALKFALGQLPTSIVNDFVSRQHDRREQGRAMIAQRLAEALGRYEILSSAPLAHPAGDALFKNAARRGLPNETLTSGGDPAEG